MRFLRLIFAAFLALIGLTGCFQVERVVKLKPDGSGTIEETVMIPKAALAKLQELAPGKPADVFDEAKLKQAASQMGDGVTFVSAKKVSSDAGEGFIATYAFADINKLKIDQNPGDAIGGAAGGPPQNAKKDPIVFHFTKGQPSELSVSMPAPQFKPKKDASEGPDEAALLMMQQMLKDLKITMALEVDGTISETNAEYHQGSRVTFMDVDFNKVLADPAKFKAMTKANPQTIEEAKALIKEIDGVKIETSPQLKIKFQ